LTTPTDQSFSPQHLCELASDLSLTAKVKVEDKWQVAWTTGPGGLERYDRVERRKATVSLQEAGSKKAHLILTAFSSGDALDWCNKIRTMLGMISLPPTESCASDSSSGSGNSSDSSDEEEEVYQKPPQALASVRRENVFKLLLLHGAITTNDFAKLLKEDKKPQFKGPNEVEEFIRRHGPSWGLWIEGDIPGKKVIKMQLTNKTLDEMEELPSVASQRMKLCRERVLDSLCKHFKEVTKHEYDDDDAAHAFIKWIYAALLRDEGYEGQNLKEHKDAWPLYSDSAKGIDQILPRKQIRDVLEGAIKGWTRKNTEMEEISLGVARKIVESWVKDIKKIATLLQDYKLGQWLKILDLQEATDAKTWTDESLNVVIKHGPKPKLVSLVLRGSHESEVDRAQMGQEVYDKLATRYRALGHDSTKMHSRMFVLIRAYDLLCINTKTYGMQGTVLPTAMKVMKEEFEVQGECYASPMNRCNFEPWQFCSALHYVDKWFGSEGSFYHFRPKTGSFECNPPFTNDTVDHMMSHIIELLKSSEQPLSIIVVIPTNQWDHVCNWFKQVGGVPFAKKVVALAMHDHEYLTGNWYNSAEVTKDETWHAPMSTTLIWMQNDAGHAKWLPTPEKIAKLISAFRYRESAARVQHAGWQPAMERQRNSNQQNRNGAKYEEY